jgi:lauroyl/myristoyl acyltransferase
MLLGEDSRAGAALAPANRVAVRLQERWARAERFLEATTGMPPSPVLIGRQIATNLVVRLAERKPLVATRRRVEGAEHLAGAIAQGRGVIAVHTHLWGPSFDTIALGARGFGGTVVGMVWPEEADARLRRLQSSLAAVGIDMMFRGEGSMFDRLSAALQEGRTLHVSADVPGSTPVRFLGRDGRITGGIASLAVATGALVVPVAPTRSGLGVRVLPAIEPGDDAAALAQRLCDWLSEEILAQPAAWEDNELGLAIVGRTADPH